MIENLKNEILFILLDIIGLKFICPNDLKDVDFANDILVVAEGKIKYQKAKQDAI